MTKNNLPKRIIMLGLYSLLLCLSQSIRADALLPQDVPPLLQPWINWVLHDTQDDICPPYYNQSPSTTKKATIKKEGLEGICQWPSLMTFNVKSTQAEFSQTWQVYSAGWIALPGNAKHWPQQVQINDTAAVVADRDGVPSIFAEKGELTLRGQFHFSHPPEFLPIPATTGLIDLTINNAPVAIPRLDEQGRLWLQQRGITREKAVENRLELRVYRHIIDDIPLQVITRIELDVAGHHREVILGPVLLDQHQAMSLSSPLPARLEADGQLRLQVRPGSWTLTLHTRQIGAVNQLKLISSSGQWVDREMWVFEARNDLRLVEIQGVSAINPQQTALPNAWRQFPAYQMQVGEILEIVEKRRGDPEPAPDQLNLDRHYWLDFDGKGYTVQDRISGSMTRFWRLEMASPAILGRVAVNGKDQFITRLAENSQNGVEVRRGEIDLVADSRLEKAVTQLPAVGWAHDFQQVQATLHLPPGWRLFSATGVDHVPGTWLKQWSSLLDFFIVLIMAVAVGKLWHWVWGVLTLITMVLIYHETKAPHFVWLSIIASLALVRVLPTQGWFSRSVRFYRNLSLITLLIIALPFMMQQVRQSIYPQLERPWATLEQPSYAPPTMISQSLRRPFLADQVQQAMEPLPHKSRYQTGSFSYAGKVRSKLVQIDPNAQVQTGPGLPQWKWRDVTMRWSGPVQQNQSVHLWLLSPTVNSVLSILNVMFLAILIAFFLWVSWGPGANNLKTLPITKKKTFTKRKSKFNEKCPSKAIQSVALLLVSLLLCLPTYAQEPIAPQQVDKPVQVDKQVTNKSSFPPQSLLDELQNRLLSEHHLLTQPECLPYCASSPRLFLELSTQQLSARMEIHSHADVVVPLPGIAKQWLPQQVLLNGEPASNLWRDKKGQLWIKLIKGIHQIQMTGSLPNRHTVQLPLPLKPHFVTVKAEEWDIEGVHENGVADAQLQFTRKQTDETHLIELEMGSLPPFVQIERTLLLGLDWQVMSRVIRKTPLGSAIVLEIPLLQGEAVTSEGIRVEKGHALINLSSNRSEIRWTSVLEKQEVLTLLAPENAFSSETWRLDASAMWHVEIEGIPIVHHQAQGRWLPEWRPWPGEKVILHLSRPKGVTGQVLTIDRSQLIVTPGQNTSHNQLLLNLRSSRGMQHPIKLPKDAQLQSVNINGKSQPIRQEGRVVTLPIMPGAQRVELQFRQPIGISGMSRTFHTPPIDLGIDSVNTLMEIKMPQERWILFVGGEPIGPAVMIWGILIVITLVSIGLGQVSLTPLNVLHWLLLGMVLSQVNVGAMLIVVGWLMMLGWRAQMSSDIQPLKFNAIQISIGILTVIALSILSTAIYEGLLGHPNMHIAGNGSTAYHLRWYEDRIGNILPQVWVFSWSMWVYRIAMLLWALWLSFALIRWLRWGWEGFSTHGLWKTLWTKK
ncbi:MAG: hypothetical protein DRQ49_03735 [Gammaproteobacteria bacterium]|nr:MAG: hypothetical protein DRQ49_03735 [Gammaproteobacteria bacterium]RKZ44613.1 MAG: hypothetical protein DRQ41_02320 [Gammaproteobacteria bacterium]RKZ73956.1 MAG: hypothetical protein DRQ57_12710 [Gammaproteobacteria bacterium]